jgi:hypothetical protein
VAVITFAAETVKWLAQNRAHHRIGGRTAGGLGFALGGLERAVAGEPLGGRRHGRIEDVGPRGADLRQGPALRVAARRLDLAGSGAQAQARDGDGGGQVLVVGHGRPISLRADAPRSSRPFQRAG